MNVKIINYTYNIYRKITNKQIKYISNVKRAYDIIKKFKIYLKKITMLQIVYRNNFENITLKNYQK